jgi:hypothetical protein
VVAHEVLLPSSLWLLADGALPISTKDLPDPAKESKWGHVPVEPDAAGTGHDFAGLCKAGEGGPATLVA